MSKYALSAGKTVAAASGAYVAPTAPSATLPLPTPAPVPAAVLSTESEEGLYVIKSPIVGTFYEGSSPGAPAFVKEGDTVTVGQVLCIVEAMKLMNEIESEAAGQIVKILVVERSASRVRPATVQDSYQVNRRRRTWSALLTSAAFGGAPHIRADRAVARTRNKARSRRLSGGQREHTEACSRRF